MRAWTHLERQRGGLGFVGGPGETQIEADRRAIDEQVARLKRQLDRVVKTRELHRAARRKVPFPLVALVGYTNAGKSTLFNRMTGADVLAQDMLFATLDPTMRGIVLPSGRKIIASDTVGFISDLPTQLVAAFRATLEEVREADLILHVRDISHSETAEQAADVEEISASLASTRRCRSSRSGTRSTTCLPEARGALMAQAENRDRRLSDFGADRRGVGAAVAGDLGRAFEEEKLEEVLRLDFAEGKARARLHEMGVVVRNTAKTRAMSSASAGRRGSGRRGGRRSSHAVSPG